MKKIIVSIFFIVIPFFTFSQYLNVDSVNREINKMPNDTNKVFKYIDCGYLVGYSNPKAAYDWGNKALKLSTKIKFDEGISIAYAVMGNTKYGASNYREAIPYYQKSLQIAIAKNLKRLEMINYSSIAASYCGLEEYDLSLIYYNRSINCAVQLKDSIVLMRDISEMLPIYSSQGKYKYVDSIGQKCATFLARKKDDFAAGSYCALGENALMIGNYKKAIDYFEQALICAKQVQQPLYYSYLKLAKVHIKSNNLRKVKNYLDNSRNYLKTINDDCELVICYLIYFDYEFKNQNLEKCLLYLDSASICSGKCGNELLSEQTELNKNYSLVYEKLGDNTKALDYYKKFKTASDSSMAGINNDRVLKIQTKFQVQEKEAKINLLSKERALQTTQIELQQAQVEKAKNSRNIIIAVAIILIISILLIYYRFKNKKETEKILSEKEIIELEQKLLLTQMNPHFIFNSLNSIRMFILKNNTSDADRYLMDFAKLMRLILESSRKEFIPISDEINILEYYLKLEQLRTKTSFDYHIDIEEKIVDEGYDLKIPSMLLQPFVENAILHGISNSNTKGSIKLNISYTENNEIMAVIEDNGIGRDKANAIKMAETPTHESLATKITEERINGFQKKYKKLISINIVDLLDNKLTCIGTKVTIKIPVVNI